MDAWDQEKLEDVVNKKHGSKNKGLPPTTIVSLILGHVVLFSSVVSSNFAVWYVLKQVIEKGIFTSCNKYG